jgi:hypothetical protein
VEAARGDLHSPGLAVPWISVPGNHDALLQGTVPADDRLRSLAVGSERITGLPAGVDPLSTHEAIPGTGPARYLDERRVSPARRSPLTRPGSCWPKGSSPR